MNNKILYIIIAILVVIIIAGGIFIFVSINKPGKTISNQNQPAVNNQTPPTNETLSEQPNQEKFNEYISEIYLGKMAVGKKIGTDGFPEQTNIFTTAKDQFCTMLTLKKTIPGGKTATAIYNTITKQYDQPKTNFPIELKAGGSGGCGTLTQSPGKYEYKLYIDDVLAAVLPFEVK